MNPSLLSEKTDAMEECDYCGNDYDSNCEGHEHFEDGGCDCKYCQTIPSVKGKKFCSPECEAKFINRLL